MAGLAPLPSAESRRARARIPTRPKLVFISYSGGVAVNGGVASGYAQALDDLIACEVQVSEFPSFRSNNDEHPTLPDKG